MIKDLPGSIEKAINEFSKLLKQRLGANLLEIRLFGSVARGRFTLESDIDILIVAREDIRLVREIAMDVVVDINLKYDVVISPVIMLKEHYSASVFRETLFFKALQEEGYAL